MVAKTRSATRAASEASQQRATPQAVTPKKRGRPRLADEAAPVQKLSRRMVAKGGGPIPADPKPEVRVAPIADIEVLRLQRAAAALRPGNFDASFEGRLPCREQEQEDINLHLRTAVQQGGSVQVLYISGMPGTGKTASVLRTLQQLEKAADVPAFVVVHINAMRLGTPNVVFSAIHSQLPRARGKCAVAAAAGEVTNFFDKRRLSDPVVVLLLDEIDHLVTKSQTVLYRVFDWLQLPRPRLVIAAISNTMDLPERLLPRVASRFAIVRVEYQPYNRQQIIDIISKRLVDASAQEAINPVVLKLSAAKIAASSGDIRKAVQVLRRAVEVRLNMVGASGPTDLKHFEAAERELLRASPAATAIRGLSVGARRLLTSVLLELRKVRGDAVPLYDVTMRYAKLAVAAAETEEAAPMQTRISGNRFQVDVNFLADRLESMALLTQSLSTTDRILALGAGLDTEDLAAALEPAEENPGIRSLISDS